MAELLTLVAIGLIIYLIGYSIYSFFYPYSKRNIAKTARLLISKIEAVQRELYTLLEPNHFVTSEEIDEFKSKHQNIISEVDNFMSLNTFGIAGELEISEFQHLINYKLDDLVSKNHSVCFSIQELRKIVISYK